MAFSSEPANDVDQRDTLSPDVSMSDEGDAHITDGSVYDPATALLDEMDTTDAASTRKRKSPSPGSDELATAKRVRLAASREAFFPQDRAQQLPAEIWHHIFTFLDPRALGRLLPINKLFHNYLDPATGVKTSCPPISSPPILPFLSPNVIWQASRRAFWPKMPGPLKTRSELDMWRIACSRACQICKTRDAARTGAAVDQWHRGPGAKGVSPVFPFLLVCCGDCLSQKSLKEIDILLSSSTPSVLLQALPMVFMTSELHVISPHTISAGGLPPLGQVTKLYWPEHVDSIKSELDTVRSLGSAAAEEWFKGLEIRGKHALADASRWERWSQSGGVDRMRQPLQPVASGLIVKNNFPAPLGRQGSGHDIETATATGASNGGHSFLSTELHGPKADTPAVPTEPPRGRQQKRTIEEVAELKTMRKAEIERRALLLDPPIPARVLAHMSSFQAALQIISPLDDKAWERLKTRLLAQRAVAEQQDTGITKTNQAVQDKLNPPPAMTEAAPKEVSDKDWDDIQGPVRARISGYADEIIRDGWDDGEKVTKKNSPQFAAEVLIQVRKRFYAEVTKDAVAAVASGESPITDPPQGPWTQKLTLENMKWVFDMKLKQYTEKHRKELFLCNDCDGNHKFYGFEGVVQHYSAKHTDTLSMGSVVVYWRAEWPEKPIFNPNPKHAGMPRPVNTNNTQPPPGVAPPPYGPNGYPNVHPGVYPIPDGYYGYSSHNPHAVPPTYGPGPASAISHNGPYGPFPQPGGYAPYNQRPPGAHLQHGEQIPVHHQIEPDFGSLPARRAEYTHMTSSQFYDTRLALMAKVAKETWAKIAGVKGLPGTVKVCVTIHHIAKRFQDEFSEAATLAMFIDGISNNKEMRPVRSVNHLFCKACTTDSGAKSKSNTYSLPRLINHFHSVHVKAAQSQGLAPLDWRVDMMLLPEMSVLSKLRNSLKPNKPALKLVRDTLPWAFETAAQPAKKAATSVPAAPEPIVDEEDDHYSPPESIEQPNGRHTQMWPAMEAPLSSGHTPVAHGGVEQPLHQTRPPATRTKNAKSSQQMPPPIKQESGEDHPTDSVPRSSDRPNLKPASVVYSSKDSRRFGRPRHDQSGDVGASNVPVERPNMPVENPGVPTRGRKPRHRKSGPSPSYQVEMDYGDEQAVAYEDRNEYSQDVYRQGAHPEDYPREEHRREVQPLHAYQGDTRVQRASPSQPRPQEVYMRDSVREDARPQDIRPRDAPQRWEDDPYEPRRTVAPPVPTWMPAPQPSGGEFGLLDALESHLDSDGRGAPKLEPRRVARQGTAVPEYHTSAVRYVDERGFPLEDRRRPISPRYAQPDPYVQSQYRERSPLPRYERPVYRDEQGYLTYRAHPGSQPPRLAAPAPVEAYEIVEVRDPQGNYYIKRPVHRVQDDGYAYDGRSVVREPEPRRHLPSSSDSRPAAYMYPDGQPSDGVPRGRPPPRRDEEDEYDPRYPAADKVASSAPRPQRY